MAIVTDQTITIHGVSVGISKPIQTLIANGDFTYAELSKFAIVGRYDFVNDKAGVFEPDTYSYMAGTSAVISELEKYPVLNSPTAPGWDSVLYEYFGSGNRSYDNYGKMVLVYNMVSSDNTIGVNFNDGNTACIVTEFNPRLIKMMGSIYTGNVVADVGDTGSYTIYDPEASTNFVWYDDDTSAPFRCLCIQNFGDAVYFDFPLYNNIFNTKQNISGNRDSTYVSLDYIFDDYASSGNKLLSVWCDGGIDDFLVGANYGTSFVGVHDMSDDRGDKILVVRYVPYGAENSVKASSLDTALKQLAGCGFYFEANGTVYKPITTDGIVTGYTADLSKNGQWDLINDVTGNTVPDTPPSPIPPTPSGDDMDSQELGATGSSGGFTKFFVMTPQDLSDFLTDFYSRAEPGETLSGNLVCSYILGVASSNWGSTESKPITIHNSAQGTPFVSAANYSLVNATNNYLTIGTYDVPRKTGTFYDFSPYSTYELFIPCCGWITLPDSVAGRTIRVSLQIDIATCSAKGIVKFDNGGTCAVCSGVLGSSIPMQVIESGLLRGANVQAGSNALGGALMSGAGFGSGNAGLGLGGISQVVSSFAQSAIAGNTNYTNQKGSSGDITQFAMGHNCYLKITYPPIDEVVNDSMFGHTVGYLCEEVGILSSFHGFTVCSNPHVHINATSTEKEEIKTLLEQGVILPYGE